jgi:hypothetical protein
MRPCALKLFVSLAVLVIGPVLGCAQQARAGCILRTTTHPSAVLLPDLPADPLFSSALWDAGAASSTRLEVDAPKDQPSGDPLLPCSGNPADLCTTSSGGMSSTSSSAGGAPTSQPPGVVTRISLAEAEAVGRVISVYLVRQPVLLASRLFRPPRAAR